MPKPTREQEELAKKVEDYRQEVVMEELLARYNKATYEKMNYYILGTEIMPKFAELWTASEKQRRDIETARQQQGEQAIATAFASTPETSSEPTSGSLEIGPATPTEA